MARPLLLCAVLGLAGTAAAQAPRYFPRRPPARVTVTLSDRVKAPPPRPVDPSRRRPTLTADVLGGAPPPAIVRKETEQLLVELIASTPDSAVDEKSDLYFRLADVYAQQHRVWKQQPGREAQNKAKAYLLNTVRTLKALTENAAFRHYPKLDAALFTYGATLLSGEYRTEARAVFARLLQAFPQSPYAIQAQLVLADDLFDDNQLADAESIYQLILKTAGSPVRDYVLYRLGWVHMNLQRFPQALEAWFTVVERTRGDAKETALYQAAKQGVFEAYAEVGTANRAAAVFAKIDPAQVTELLDALAARYLEDGKHAQAIYLYQELIKTAPDSARVCWWQYSVARAMQWSSTATNPDKVREIENLVKLYVALEANKTLPRAAAQDCHDNAAAMVGEIARVYHIESAKNRAPEAFAAAEALYRLYVEQFPDAADAAEAWSGYGDVQWEHAATEVNARLRPARWALVSRTFVTAARLASDPSRRLELIGVAAMARKNALDVDPRLEVQAGPIDLEAAARSRTVARTLAADEAETLETLELYAAGLADRSERAGAKFLIATLARRYGQHDRAIAVLTELVDRDRDPATDELAANLLLDSMLRLQRFDETLVIVDKLAADRSFLDGKPTLVKNIALLRSRSLRRR